MHFFNNINLEIFATYCIAVGALIIATSLIFGSDESHVVLIPKAPFSKREDRLWFATTASGVSLTLIGSLSLGIKYWSQIIILIPITIIGYSMFHCVASWKLWQYYKNQPRVNAEQNQHNLIWCLRHPYSNDDEPINRIAIQP